MGPGRLRSYEPCAPGVVEGLLLLPMLGQLWWVEDELGGLVVELDDEGGVVVVVLPEPLCAA
jgi:hypothetical protein